jgi:ATP-dependent helicase/nuclease subunit A
VEDLSAGGAVAAVAGLAAVYAGEDLRKLLRAIAREAGRFRGAADPAAPWRALGLPAGLTRAGLCAGVFGPGDAAMLAAVAAILAGGSAADAEAAGALHAAALALPSEAALVTLEAKLLFGDKAKAPFSAKIGSIPTKTTLKTAAAAFAPLADDFHALMRRVEAARPTRLALAAAERAAALHRFAAPFLDRYEARKAALGQLDFDDLITRARDLLTDPSVAQWVLFRLDGGLDHILVDEAQDTSPGQWQVIERLAQDFLAGEGQRPAGRSLFVVGDKKQSIYAFQGADLRAFDAMREQFRGQLAGGAGLALLDLDYSFRSSPAILRAVDATFDAQSGRGLGGAVLHRAFHGGLPGRVDLWPAVPKAAVVEPENWFDPVDMPGDRHHDAILAEAIAAEVRRLIDAGTTIPHPQGNRRMRPGDVLILVQRRSELFHEIIRACKAAGLPIAGADRLRLGGEIAVRDLTALLSFLATPEDDLSLAEVLRSPLFGWTEDALFRLASGRQGYLWAALRACAADHPETVTILADLRDRSEFLRPFELLDRMLTRHDGRRRLVARLGAEAEDGIEQLLAEALRFEEGAVATLTGFLTWLATGEVDVKRQMDAASDQIRVMTVHGAKGLEAPVVILPDSAGRGAPKPEDLIRVAGVPFLRMPSDATPAAMAAAQQDEAARREEEWLRLLYVAMTRAECWLIVAAAGDTEAEGCWHALVRDGLVAAGAAPCAMPTGEGLRLAHGVWPDDGAAEGAGAQASAALPDWVLVPPPRAAAPPALLTPSGLGGDKTVADAMLDPAEAADLAEAAMRRGTMVHLLLEHLPPLAPDARQAEAARLLGPQADPGIIAAALRVLEAPALRDLFAQPALTEVTITAPIGARHLLGVVDRLVLLPDRVLAIDYKTNALVPASVEAVPEGLLRQMGAYRAALAQIHPGCRVEVALLWTADATLMVLPDTLVDAALARGTEALAAGADAPLP